MKKNAKPGIDGWDPKNIPVAITCGVVGAIAIIVMVLTVASAKPPWPEQASQVPKSDKPATATPSIISSDQTTPQPSILQVPSKYTAAYETNNDLIGWLDIPDTIINYPLVQTIDNEKYLKTDFDGTLKDYGNAIFVDYRADLSKNQNPVVYGHNLLSGEGFAQLCRYWPWFEDYNGTVSFAEKHPIIEYDDFYDDGRDEYLVFAATYVTANIDDPYYIDIADYIDIESKAEFEDKISAILDRSAFYNDSIKLKYGDRILILSTCLELLGHDKNTRLLVFARQARGDESLDDYDPKFTINDEPLYFQEYYDIMGGSWDPNVEKAWSKDIIENQ